MSVSNSLNKKKEEHQRWIILLCLVLAGEMIFSLPFHVTRYFRPTLLEVFKLSNANLGDAIALYGVTAMLSYFPSGVIADRFSAKKLMSLALLLTAMGGLYFALIPGQVGLTLLFGYWGVTTILFFWSAMIRVTREWGGKFAQGKAFGLLDGGRGLAGALGASLAVFFLASILPENLEQVTSVQRMHAMKAVIYLYSFLTLGSAVLVWFFIPETQLKTSKSNPFVGITKVFQSRQAWLQALIIVCAYCGYRGLDYYALYGMEVLNMNEVTSAQFVSYATYLRPVAAIGAGFLADRLSTRNVLKGVFFLLILSYLIFLFVAPAVGVLKLLFANLVFTILAVYALRGVYFALFEETKVPTTLTGTTAGLVSLIGFTPDIFFNSLAGRILDASPGMIGYQHFYLFLCCFAVIGLLATMALSLRQKNTIKGSDAF